MPALVNANGTSMLNAIKDAFVDITIKNLLFLPEMCTRTIRVEQSPYRCSRADRKRRTVIRR
jgi:hypothetical protein